MANAPSLSVTTDSARPRKLGRYELEDKLGGEDGTETFRARVRGLAGFDRIFAVKCLRRPRGNPVNLNDPFIKAARRLAGINDPRVARVLDADVIDGVAVAVTEFVHGLDLDRFRECAQYAGVLATGNDEAAAKWQKIVAYVGAEVAGGLSAIHALTPPLVHGGVSPRNVVATARGGIKILDAGLARAAGPTPTGSSKRSLAYAAASGTDGIESSPKGDVRALGALLFELATGELPPPPSPSTTVRAALDSLWPAMADFIAGLLADDPTLRPDAAEAAKILADYWSDIPDASMVTEIAALVRNFSAFVAEAGVPTTSPPIVEQPPRAPEPEPSPAEVLSITPQPPSSPGAVQPVRGLFEDEPTVIRPSGTYAAALFEAAADQPDGDEPLILDGPKVPPVPPPVPGIRATLLAYPAPEAPMLTPPETPISGAFESFEADAPQTADPSVNAAFPALASAVRPEPIPELADWGAQALASLGNQAGITIAPLVPSPAPLAMPEPPPPVSDPAIEEAFAFTPPAPAETAAEVPVLEAQAELDPEPLLELPPTSAGQHPPDQTLLEDDLVDDTGTGVGRALAFDVGLSADRPKDGPGQHASTEVAEESPVEPVAIDEIAPAAGVSQGEPETRMAHAMPAPEESGARHAGSRKAAESSSAAALSEIEADGLASSTRGRRIAIGIALFMLAGGAVFGGLSVSGVLGKKHHAAGTHEVLAPKPRAVAVTASAPAPDPAQPKAAAPTAAVEVPRPPLPAPTRKAIVEDRAGQVPTPPPAPSRAAAPDISPSGAPTVSVSVASTPSGAMVWVDGEERGTTPCSLKLPRGSARLTLVLAGHVSSTSTIDVSDGKAIEQTLQAAGPPPDGDARFRAECKTAGKLPIVVDGRETGILCPYSKMRVPPGAHSIGVLVPATGKVHAKEITLAPGVRSIVFGD